MVSLSEEIIPDPSDDWHAGSSYRGHLVQACLYKSFLKILGDQVPENLRSAAERELPRAISSGTQTYQVNPDLWPMNKPIHKLESPAQCTGTAEYVADIPAQPDELHGVTEKNDHVLTTAQVFTKFPCYLALLFGYIYLISQIE